MTTTLELGQIVVDCHHAAELADFWSRLLDLPVVEGANDYFAVIPPSPGQRGPALMFLAVPESRQGKNRLHLDLLTPDLATEVDRAVGLGAVKLGDYDEHGTIWSTLEDPQGNVFDIGLSHEHSAANG